MDEWMNGRMGACWGSERDLMAEQRSHCASLIRPACRPPLSLPAALPLPAAAQLLQRYLSNSEKGPERLSRFASQIA